MMQEQERFASEAAEPASDFRAALRETWPALLFVTVTLAIAGVGVGWLIWSFVAGG